MRQTQVKEYLQTEKMERLKNDSRLSDIGNPLQLNVMHDLGLATGPEKKRHCWDSWKNLRVFCELDGRVVLILFSDFGCTVVV